MRGTKPRAQAARWVFAGHSVNASTAQVHRPEGTRHAFAWAPVVLLLQSEHRKYMQQMALGTSSDNLHQRHAVLFRDSSAAASIASVLPVHMRKQSKLLQCVHAAWLVLHASIMGMVGMWARHAAAVWHGWPRHTGGSAGSLHACSKLRQGTCRCVHLPWCNSCCHLQSQKRWSPAHNFKLFKSDRHVTTLGNEQNACTGAAELLSKQVQKLLPYQRRRTAHSSKLATGCNVTGNAAATQKW